MIEALQPFVVGVALSVVSGLAIWWCTVRCRAALPSSYWATEWAATSLSLLLVGLIVIAGALVVKAALVAIPEAIVAVFGGMFGTVAVVIGTVRVMDQHPTAHRNSVVSTPVEHDLSDSACRAIVPDGRVGSLHPKPST